MGSWRRTLVIGIAFGAIVGVATVARAVDPFAIPCNLPGAIFCTTDPECAAYGAVCGPGGSCVCPAVSDAGAGGVDGAADLAVGGGAAPPDGGVPNLGTQPPPLSGGTLPQKHAGCSFVPGQL
jgi:hypothetical protein